MAAAKIKIYKSMALAFAACFSLSCQSAIAAHNCHATAEPGVDWSECDKKLLILEGQDLSGANLFDADFTSTDLRNSNLLATNFEKATLVRASLAGSKANGARFVRIEAYRTDFSRMEAQGAVFTSAEMQRSNFQESNLKNADFTKADLGRAQFDKADISSSRFSYANLSRADFRRATFTSPIDFDHAFFFLTRIEGVDLSATNGLSQWQIDMSCGDAQTILPSGLSRPEVWPCTFQQE